MSCSRGKIERAPYVRKAHSRKAHSRSAYKTASGTKVASTYVKGSYVDKTYVPKTCVPDKGKHGKTPLEERVLPKPGKELSLSRYGYSTDLSKELRHKALMSASRDNDELVVLRRLNLLRNYQADAKAKKRMSDDVEFMKKAYVVYKEKQGRGSKKNSRGGRKISKRTSKNISKKVSKKGSKRASKKISRKGYRKGSRK